MKKKLIALGLALVAMTAMTGCAGMALPYVKGNLEGGFKSVGGYNPYWQPQQRTAGHWVWQPDQQQGNCNCTPQKQQAAPDVENIEE